MLARWKPILDSPIQSVINSWNLFPSWSTISCATRISSWKLIYQKKKKKEKKKEEKKEEKKSVEFVIG